MFYSIEDTGTGVETTTDSRDIRFIDAVFPDGSTVMVYRNEDTGWFWPPYFKWDSSTLQAEATNLKSDKANPKWVAVTHYGWRMPIFSIFPNAVAITPVEGPDVHADPLGQHHHPDVPGLRAVHAAHDVAAVPRADGRPGAGRCGRDVRCGWARVEAARKEARGFFGRIGAWLGTWRAKK